MLDTERMRADAGRATAALAEYARADAEWGRTADVLMSAEPSRELTAGEAAVLMARFAAEDSVAAIDAGALAADVLALLAEVDRLRAELVHVNGMLGCARVDKVLLEQDKRELLRLLNQKGGA